MKLSEIAGLLAKATPGPWNGDDAEMEVWSEGGSWIADTGDSNAALIAAAPALAALALRLADVVKAFVPICDGLEDAGPDGEGWQSDELVDALAAARSLLAELEG